MPSYQHPGVYIEHVPSGVLAIEAASTSVAAFVGHTGRGKPVTADSGEPVFITSANLYATYFGPLGGGGGIRDLGAKADAFGHAVSSFFVNGGTKAYIVPVAKDAGTASKASTKVTGFDVTFTATSGGAWADGLVARLIDLRTGEFTLLLGTLAKLKADGTPDTAGPLDVLETHTGLTLDTGKVQSIDAKVNGVSNLVTVALVAGGAAATFPLTAVLGGGAATAVPDGAAYGAALDRLRDYRDIAIIVLPGQTWDTGPEKDVIGRAITHAEFMQNRMVIVDPKNPEKTADQLSSPVDVKNAGFPTSPYTALYYPWLTAPNPYYNPDAPGPNPSAFSIAPSGAAAGMWARIDSARGVWKAPAGLEATVRGASGPNVLIGNEAQDNLNEWGVNCLRAIIGPTVIWGARTLASKAKPEFRYIPVRRTQNMIGESLYNALQAVVFEPNDHRLWASLRGSVGDFMSGLHRAGAFQGEKASDAWYVRCGLGATMEQGDIDAGIVRVVVGFAPLKPAEFVVVQIQQIVGQSA